MLSQRCGRNLAIAAASLVILAAPALAQPTVDERGYVMGLGGAAITEVNAGSFGGGAGFNLTRHIQVVGEVGRLQDVFASFTKEDFRLLEQEMLTEEGVTMAIRVKMPAVYAIGGLRVLVPTNTLFRPYVTATAGVAHLAPKPTILIEGIDLTGPIMQAEPGARTALRDENRPVVGIGGGITMAVARHFTVDVGYKYSRIFIPEDYLQDDVSPHQHSGINVHRLQLGLGFTF
jgi:opacity protein-like surface antigen